MLSPTHVVLLAFLILLALVVFGPKRLPELGQSLGRAIQEFKKASASAVDQMNTVTNAATHVADPPTSSVDTTPVRPVASDPSAGGPDTTD